MASEGGTPDVSTDETAVVVIFFDDMKGSMALQESMAEKGDEQAFQQLRREHDALLTAIITRDGAGEVIKSTGDGLLAIFYKPSTAVERSIEIQEKLHGQAAPQQLRLARSWESVARDGRDFAERGAGMMYWFKVPLGGICYPEGFRNFLQPALANPQIRKVRFALDASTPIIRQIWHELVLPLSLQTVRIPDAVCGSPRRKTTASCTP